MEYLIRSPFDVEALQAGCILPQSNAPDFLELFLGGNVSEHNITPMRPQSSGKTFEEMQNQCDSKLIRDPVVNGLNVLSLKYEIPTLFYPLPVSCVVGFRTPKQQVSALKWLHLRLLPLSNQLRTWCNLLFNYFKLTAKEIHQEQLEEQAREVQEGQRDSNRIKCKHANEEDCSCLSFDNTCLYLEFYEGEAGECYYDEPKERR